ncbi:hypothetical protein [Ascidiimonas sp. W6]|uniref:hypothetical protein n=1 Tax=Ascidiimonas meishanensis TaxID=3128903 RepID=UPI0030EE34EE
MERDLRELFKESNKIELPELRQGHEKRFEQKLDQNFPRTRTNTFFYLKVAASLLILITTGYFLLKSLKSEVINDTPDIVNTIDKEAKNPTTISLGDISPGLKKVEDYYVTNIHIELSEIEVTATNKKLFDGYMAKLSELNDEYQNLSEELVNMGPNEQTITALIDNLQLRLQLLYQLKEKLKELKETKDDKFKDKQV